MLGTKSGGMSSGEHGLSKIDTPSPSPSLRIPSPSQSLFAGSSGAPRVTFIVKVRARLTFWSPAVASTTIPPEQLPATAGPMRELSLSSQLSSVKESTSVPTASDMLRELGEDQGIVVRTAREAVAAAQAADDEVTADLAISRMDVHEKNAWMLRSHLE